MRLFNKLAITISTGIVLSMGATSASAECSDKNWKDCAGKPWVDGTKMETPLAQNGSCALGR